MIACRVVLLFVLGDGFVLVPRLSDPRRARAQRSGARARNRSALPFRGIAVSVASRRLHPWIPSSMPPFTFLPIGKPSPVVESAARKGTLVCPNDRARAPSYRTEHEHEQEKAARTKPSTEVAGRRRLTRESFLPAIR